MTFNPKDVHPSGLAEDLEPHEFVAIDSAGHVVARASNRQGVEAAAPHATAYFGAGELKHLKKDKNQPTVADAAGGAAAEATRQDPEHSFEEILAHVEGSRDTEANHEEQKRNAEKVVVEQKAAKVNKAEQDKANLEKRGVNPNESKAVTDVLGTDEAKQSGDNPKRTNSADNAKVTANKVGADKDQGGKAAASKTK